MQKITPFLWFDDKAEEAANFYTSIFKNSRILSVTRYGEEAAKAAGRPKESVMTVVFELEGQEFIALNGGPVFTFSPAISLVVNCKTQKEVDELWKKMSEGGEKGQCGWLKDELFLTSDLFLLPGARHYVQMDEPEEVARLILSMPIAGTESL